MEKQYNEAIVNKDLEIETMKNQMKVALEDLDSKTHKIEKEIDRNREAILLKDAEIDELNAKLTVKAVTLKVKIWTRRRLKKMKKSQRR